ncbi:MAG: hypothetical protein V7742_00275 [Halioglobus sp.]
MRTVILHGHIFKNAGTTFDWSLKRNFRGKFYDHRDDLEMRKGRMQYLESFLAGHPAIEALSSHHLNFPIPQSNTLDFISCYILRNPISRIRSVYNFERQQKSDSLGAVTAKKLSFLDYTLWRMNEDIPNTIRNFQTAYVSGTKKGKHEAINHETFSRAVDILKGNEFIGTVDRYDESMVVFESFFKARDIDIDLSHKPQNVMDKRDRSEEQKMLDVLDDLGTDANLVFSKNLYDYRLYRTANEVLSERILNIRDFDGKLADFKARCRKL